MMVKRGPLIFCTVRSNVCKSEIGGDEKHRRPNIKFVTEGLLQKQTLGWLQSYRLQEKICMGAKRAIIDKQLVFE